MYPTYDGSSYPNYSASPSNNGAGIEYSIISSILNPPASGANTSPAAQDGRPSQAATPYGTTQPQPGLVTASWPSEPQYSASSQQSTSNGYGANGSASTSYSAPAARPTNTSDMSPPSVTESAAYMRLQNSYGSNQTYAQPSSSVDGSSVMSYDYNHSSQGPTPPTTAFNSPTSSMVPPYQRTPRGATTSPSWTAPQAMSVDSGIGMNSGPSASSVASYANGTAAVANVGGQNQASNVYKMVTKKYDYTEGYHFLMKHISCRCVQSVALMDLNLVLTWAVGADDSRRTISCASFALWRYLGHLSSRCRCP